MITDDIYNAMMLAHRSAAKLELGTGEPPENVSMRRSAAYHALAEGAAQLMTAYVILNGERADPPKKRGRKK